MPSAAETLAVLRAAAQPLETAADRARLVDRLRGASVVLIGESTHGTQDFYALRAQLTQELIERGGFSAVAIEGDWPDAYRVNRYVQHTGPELDAVAALGGFARFPTWMWRNTAVADFVAWLRAHNAAIRYPGRRVGFYGLDLYSLHASMRAVVEYLETKDPAAARAARASYACFEEFGTETDTYAWAALDRGEGPCADAVARELAALRERRTALLSRDGPSASDEYFHAVQNARLAANAEHYYRTMLGGRVSSWNLRDRHMAETLEELRAHLRTRGQPPKVVVWAHNSHVGDARATELGASGELTLGQLVRERHGHDCRLVGLTTHSGRVMAANDWGLPGFVQEVRPALPGSQEALFHATGLPRFFLPFPAGSAAHAFGMTPRLERAIGVIYRPDTERRNHYFESRLAERFDVVVHLDVTAPVEPLEPVAAVRDDEPPETYPSGV
ncbi:MAG TPA: erythromycin esterase family protein [Opitutaceae bacterium]|nr:erythromycin esterase family protein [Opitutaceae bacterium]